MKKTKTITIIILIIISIITLFIVFNHKTDIQFNKVEMDSTIMVYNKTSLSYYDTIINLAASELMINPKVIIIDNLIDIPNIDKNIDIDAYTISKDHQYIIYIATKKVSKNKSIEVICHECVHISQYETNRLINKKDTLIFDGINYTYNIPMYDNRPWELDAILRGYILSKKLREKLIK